MAIIVLASDAKRQFDELPQPIRTRMAKLMERLSMWPAVSGAKPLRGDLAGHFRVRTGDYRLQFRVEGETVRVEKMGHRDGFYEG